MTITLPPVNPKLHAHNTGHWRVKSKAVRELRELSFALTLEQLRGRRVTWQAAVLDYTFVVADRRRRDEANMIQATKPAIDGIVDTGLIPDDDWIRLHINSVHVVIGPPGVVLTLQQVDKLFI